MENFNFYTGIFNFFALDSNILDKENPCEVGVETEI